MTASRSTRRLASAGFTLVEVLVAMAVLAFLAMVIYGAFSGMKRSKEGVERLNDRYREGRMAMGRMVRELQSAYVSQHIPIPPTPQVQKTVFRAQSGVPGDRLDFVAFAHRRLDENARESDQAEYSYFLMPDPDHPEVNDLVRRESPRIDMEPDRGGRIDVLATDVDLFDLAFLDPTTGQWIERWDTTQGTEQVGRLPLQVRITLVLNGGQRAQGSSGRKPIRLVTKVVIPIEKALTFATQGGG